VLFDPISNKRRQRTYLEPSLEHPWMKLYGIIFLFLVVMQVYAVFNPHSPILSVFPIGLIAIFYPYNIGASIGLIIIASLAISFVSLVLIAFVTKRLRQFFS
jgi:hypothetical protein